MNRFITIALTGISALALGACGGSGGESASRDFIRVVGSSTVYPFTTAVAEQFAATGAKSPVIESTGTGAGMKLFCAGIGAQHPDIENASRRMKRSEYEMCQKNGVKEIVEIQIGFDGLAFAEAKNGMKLNLTPLDIYKAIAAKPFGQVNTAKTWKDVNPALPAIPILVYGPPSTSGTRDSLEELIMMAGCDTNPEMKALKEKDKDAHEQICTEVRTDGPYVETGENDNLIVQKIAQNPRAIGAFGYSFLEANSDKLEGIPLSGVKPTYETISSFRYPGARAMYIYVKKAHLDAIKGLREFVAEWPKAWGPGGILAKKGLVISPDDVRAKYEKVIAEMTVMDPAELK
ncbi:MAG: substrate-binding domain-containing protein [Novosphingobium sp.]|nr:substrate-binding domain-containing protein [Novosphingobium sp.]